MITKSFIARVLITLVMAGGYASSLQAEPFRVIVTHLEPPLVPNSVLDLAAELGYFSREGVDVELVRVQQTPSAIAALIAGEGEMANVSVKALLLFHAQGDHSLIAIGSPNKSIPFLIASRSEIKTISDLKGHSFGVGRIGSLDHSLSTQVIEATGLSMDDLSIVTLGQPSVRAQALAANRIDATTMSIGTWMSIPQKDGLDILVPQEAYYKAAPVINKVNIVKSDVLKNRRSEILRVQRALIKISRDFAENPNSWALAMKPHATKLNDANRIALAKSFTGNWSVNGGINKIELEFTQDWVLRTDDFKNAPPITLSEWIDFSVVDEVLAEIGISPGSDHPAR